LELRALRSLAHPTLARFTELSWRTNGILPYSGEPASSKRLLGRSIVWKPPPCSRDCSPNVLNNRMRRPRSKPPTLRHENDAPSILSLRKTLDRHWAMAEPTALGHPCQVRKGHCDLRYIVGNVEQLIVHADSL